MQNLAPDPQPSVQTSGSPPPSPTNPDGPDTPQTFAHAVRLLEFDQVRQQLASYARTVMGEETALGLMPGRDHLAIATDLQETTEAREFIEGGGGLEFGPRIDFREPVQRALLGGLLRGEELHYIQELLQAARYDRSHLASRDEFPLLSGYASNIPDLSAIESAIASAISPAGEVLDDASPNLRHLRQESRAVHQRLNEMMERNLRRFQRMEVVQEPIITQRNGRLVLLIKAEMKPRVPGIVHDVSDSGSTVFVEPMGAIELGNRWREARLAEEREEERVLRQLSSQTSRVGRELLLTLDILSRLDFDMAKGRYSSALRAVSPWVSGQPAPDWRERTMMTGQRADAASTRRLRLTGARHPLLSGDVVPVTIELGGQPVENIAPDHLADRGAADSIRPSTVMLITGPNAGGKTVALKTVGLLSLMAQSGLHVPADEAALPLFDGVFVDIGDQQSIEQALSTFSSHIQNLLTIMGQATDQSLILVDELGTSTDPEEGSALGQAILNHFLDQGSLVVATTHHRGVARFVQETPGMVNASVDLHPQTLRPTYRVTMGVPGRSYALTIAARLGIPQQIIEQARTAISPVEQATEDLLLQLQEERRVIEELRQQAEANLAQSRQQQAEAEAQLVNVESRKADLVEDARQDLQVRIGDLLDRLRRAERALDRAPSPEEHRQVIQEQRAQLREAAREVRAPQWQPIEVKRTPWQERVDSGDRVFLRGIPRPVEVITPADEEGQVEVLLGTMRAKVPLYQLERPAGGHQAAAQHGVYFQRQTPRQSNTEIDLRGFRVDDALGRVDDLLNNASLDGVENIRIIHGKGTGTLRRAIREYLDHHPLASGYEGGEGNGGEGVTVVELV